MEAMVKKFQQKFKLAREQMDRWDQLQAQLLSQFRNASSIIERLQMIRDRKNYGSLTCVNGIEAAVWQKQMDSQEKQMDSQEMILLSINKTMYRLKMSIVAALPKVATKPRAGDLSTLQQLLVDQPNIPRD